VWAALGGQADVRLIRRTVPHSTHIWRTRRRQHAQRAARVHRARRRPTCVAAAAAAATFCEHVASILRGLMVRPTATQCCSMQVICEWADAQCDPNRRDAHGRTALMAAARGGCALGPRADVGGRNPCRGADVAGRGGSSSGADVASLHESLRIESCVAATWSRSISWSSSAELDVGDKDGPQPLNALLPPARPPSRIE